MYGPKFIRVGEHRADAARARFEGVIAQQRVQPDQAAAGAVQAVHFLAEQCRIAMFQTIRDK